MNRFKRTLSAVTAFAAAVSLCVPVCGSASTESSTARGLGTYEAEDLDLGGQDVWTSIYENKIPGYSGEGFVYLTNKEFSVDIEVEEDGMYAISARCAQILDEGGRQQTISVNGVEYTFILPYYDTWTDVDIGVFRFKKGVNKVSFVPKYGYGAFDTVTIDKAEFPTLTGDPVPCDPLATDETKALLSYLNSVYGSKILSGQQEIYGGGHIVQTTIRYDKEKDICVDSNGKTYSFTEENKGEDKDGNIVVWTCYDENGQAYGYDQQNHNYSYNDYDTECRYLYELTGKYPAIRGFDFNTHNPGFAWEDGVTDRMIKWAKENNGICTASWHCTVPTQMADFDVDEDGNIIKISDDWQKFTYGISTDFKTANVMVEGTKEYYFFREAMRLVAAELQKLQDAGVPVIFRPLHEAEGNPGQNGDGSGAWFWWAKEGAEVYNNLWKYLYKTFTEEYGLHNLIWEQNLYAWSDESAMWYTGDDYVDMVGFDKYNTVYNRHDGKTSGPNEDAESKIFWDLVNFVGNRKIVSMPENSTIPSMDNMVIENAWWSYFCTWYDDGDKFISGEDYQNSDTVIDVFNSEYCITLDELPEDLYVYKGSETTNPTASAGTTAPTTGNNEGNIIYGDANNDKKVDISDVVAIMCYTSAKEENPLDEQGINNADVYERGDGINSSDAVSVQKYLVKYIISLPES